jgi:hypothetical protein
MTFLQVIDGRERDRIERAKLRWERRQFPAVPNETEFIPLPQ